MYSGGSFMQRGGQALSGATALGSVLDVVMILFFVALTALTVLLFIRLLQRNFLLRGPHGENRGEGIPQQAGEPKRPPVVNLESAVLILNERFAKGEITRETYLRMREDMFRG